MIFISSDLITRLRVEFAAGTERRMLLERYLGSFSLSDARRVKEALDEVRALLEESGGYLTSLGRAEREEKLDLCQEAIKALSQA